MNTTNEVSFLDLKIHATIWEHPPYRLFRGYLSYVEGTACAGKRDDCKRECFEHLGGVWKPFNQWLECGTKHGYQCIPMWVIGRFFLWSKCCVESWPAGAMRMPTASFSHKCALVGNCLQVERLPFLCLRKGEMECYVNCDSELVRCQLVTIGHHGFGAHFSTISGHFVRAARCSAVSTNLIFGAIFLAAGVLVAFCINIVIPAAWSWRSEVHYLYWMYFDVPSCLSPEIAIPTWVSSWIRSSENIANVSQMILGNTL